MSKQDRVAPRTAEDIERRTNYRQTFGEFAGLVDEANKAARDAELAAKSAGEAVNNLDEKLDQDEIFNRLTDNGAIQGFYPQDGKLYINAELVKIINLIAETLVSKDAYGGSMEIRGGILRLYQDENTLVEVTTEYDGYPVIRMTLVRNGALTTRHEMSPQGFQVVDLTGAVPTTKLALQIDANGDPTLACKDTSGNIVSKRVAWKNNGDGTYTLIGS